MDWYVLQAFSGYENKVKITLEDRIKRSGLENSFEEILVPTEEVLEIKEGKKEKIRKKVFSRVRND
jgi:transcriptional antiterminator NusG